MAEYVNKHGRRGGRGIRPLLLIPKVVGVAMFVGGLASMAAISLLTEAATDAEVRAVGRTLFVVQVYVVEAGLVLAVIAGTLLLIQHVHILLRMRWLQAKLVLLALSMPYLLWMMTELTHAMQYNDANVDSMTPLMALRAFGYFVCGAIAVGIVLIVLGRHKPRLWQRPVTLTQRRAVREAEHA
jgi:hypothetical protein